MDCAGGTYAQDQMSSSCTPCAGTAYSYAKATSCDLCIRQYYFDDQGPDCVACIDGMDCSIDGGATRQSLTISPGYWRIAASSVDVLSCPWPYACLGGLNFTRQGDSYCSDGYTGENISLTTL